MNREIRQGLRPTIEDRRDLPLGAIVSLPKPETLPDTFRFVTLGVKDQGMTDHCSAYASDLLSELQEGVELCPEWGFAASKRISGDMEEWGQDIRTALKRHKVHGALAMVDFPTNLEGMSMSQALRDWRNWPVTTFEKAKGHKKRTYFRITGPYDHYDNIRISIQRFENERQAVLIGIDWQYDLKDKILRGTSRNGYGHAIAVIGWTSEGLILQNSAGEEAGERGCHILPREETNHFVEKYGAWMLVDMDKADAEYLLENGMKIDDSMLAQIFKPVWNFIKQLICK